MSKQMLMFGLLMLLTVSMFGCIGKQEQEQPTLTQPEMEEEFETQEESLDEEEVEYLLAELEELEELEEEFELEEMDFDIEFE